jgi:hypothetical protein
VLQVHLARPWGCTAATAAVSCIEPYDHVLFGVPGIPSATAELVSRPIESGRYRLIIAAPPGAQTTVDLAVAGPSGTTAVTATNPLNAVADVARTEGAPLAVVDASFPRDVARRSLVALGMYHTGGSEPVAPGPFQYNYCLVRGTAAPVNPNDCVVAAFAGDRNVAGMDVMKQPATFAQSIGALSLDASGLNTVAAVVEPGRYTASHRSVRGGVAPAVGGFAAWIELP